MSDAIRRVSSLPHDVTEDEHIWIELSDGVRLAARIWRPISSDTEPVPAILEFIPYRKRDLTARRDSMHHPYLAGHGYAGVRVDLRGSGDSDGVLTDEYLEQELHDAEEVLAWLADQPWCNGRTGMMGISWGGFNALQVAARRPPGLDAIVTVCSSDDRYSDDVHYMGGCLLTDNLSWASTMFAYNSSPPDPAIVGDRWRDMWADRIENSGLWLETWLHHQRRDSYWAHGSVCEDYSAVRCPVLAVSGWADGYSNAVLRMLRHLQVPRKGLIGPWSHKYPHLGEPGPAIGFLQELVRWWDHWLKDADNGVMDEPMLRVWMQDSVPPRTAYEQRPGHWIVEPAWPTPRVEDDTFSLTANHGLVQDRDVPEEVLSVESPLSLGQFAGKWCSYNAPPDLPYDQREEDGGALVFDSDVLIDDCEILGSPSVDLEVSVNEPGAMVAVRLSDVAPDGQATRITYGLLNLTHRNGHAEPERLVPGERYRIEVVLNGVAHSFPPGHRIRVAISTSYWPLAWPPPCPARLELVTGQSRLALPRRRVLPAEDDVPRPFDPPESTAPIPVTQLSPTEERWEVSRDLVDYRSALEVVKDLGVVRIDDIGLDVTRRAVERYSWVANEFDSARGETAWTMGFRRGDWKVRTETRTVLTATPSEFHLHAQLDAYEGERRIHSLNWHGTIARDHV